MERLFINISSIDKIKALLIQLNSNKLLLIEILAVIVEIRK